MRRVAMLLLCSAALVAPALAQQVSGTLFEDRDADGIHDAGEPALQGIGVELFGAPSAGGSFDQSLATDALGGFSFAPGNGCYMVRVADPAGWRASVPRFDGIPEGAAPFAAPVGQPRFGKLDFGLDHLRAGSFGYASLGDSIAWNWNSCFYTSQFWYSRQVRDRIACAAPAASITLHEEAIKGEHTDHLLIDDTDNNVFRTIQLAPQFVTISFIGNDLLGVDAGNNPTQQETDTAVQEMMDARANLQEALSALVSELPQSDITLNTLYDNEAYNCDSVAATDFHRDWVPIVVRILQETAWGQARRVGTVEAAAEFAREDLQRNCTGFEGKICRDLFQTDNIHPNNAGYQILREKVWETAGGALLGSGDAVGRTTIDPMDYGLLRRVRRLLPSASQTSGGAAVLDAAAAFDDDDAGAAATIGLGIGAEEFRLSGFPDWYDEIQIVKVLAGVRYRTAGAPVDDYYRVEASRDGVFRAPGGHAYNTINWNFYTPIVGSGGPNQPDLNPDYGDVRVLVVPDVPAYREVSATLTKNPAISADGSRYEWPALTHEELGTTEIRVVSAPVAATPGNDNYDVELDAAWLDVYGWEKPRPSELTGLRVDRQADGTLDVSFDEGPGAQRYNLYFGRLAGLAGGYDHGAAAPAGPDCDAPTQAAGPGRLTVSVAPGAQPTEDSYILVTAHVDDVESPAGFASAGGEIDRSQSTCR